MPKRERRFDQRGPVLLMFDAGAWLMVRRPHCIPFVVSRAEWNALARNPPSMSANQQDHPS